MVDLIYNYGPQWVTVGTAFIYTSGVTNSFTYTTGASSSLQEGVSYNGSWGSFYRGTTLTRSSSSSVGFPVQGNFTQPGYQSTYTYGLYKETIGTCPACTITYYVRPISFAGGSKVVWTSSVTANYCVWHQAGSSFTKETTTAKTLEYGAKLYNAIGADLSSRTGYTTTAKHHFSFSQNRNLCGTNGYPGATPGLLAARGA